MPFFEYSQNPSFGKELIDLQKGLNRITIVEAASAAEADYLFESIGGYFDGVSKGLDCECCGDRWIPLSNSCQELKGTEKPFDDFDCFPSSDKVTVHYKNGKIEHY
jgi:hypothetical protein